MRKWFSAHVTRDMIRPIIYKATSRLMYMLTLALLWDRFVNQSETGLATAFVLIFAVFMAGAWLAHLRRDGYPILTLPSPRLRLKDRPDILYGDMIDHVDEPVVNFEDLEDEEQNICLMIADAACGLVFLIASFFV